MSSQWENRLIFVSSDSCAKQQEYLIWELGGIPDTDFNFRMLLRLGVNIMSLAFVCFWGEQ